MHMHFEIKFNVLLQSKVQDSGFFKAFQFCGVFLLFNLLNF